MIELIVSIVVIGIAFMSIPLILTETSKNVETSFRQEAIMAGLTQVVNILSYRWDEQETNETINGGYAKILDTNGSLNLSCRNFADGRRRVGNFKGTFRRKCYNTQRSATSPGRLGSDGGDLDDIDDLMGSGQTLIAKAATGGKTDYKRSYSSDINVTYISDSFNYVSRTLSGTISTSPATVSTNIKMVQSTVISDNGERVVLRAFSANIGEIKYYFRNVGP